jgi:hypothetical protein
MLTQVNISRAYGLKLERGTLKRSNMARNLHDGGGDFSLSYRYSVLRAVIGESIQESRVASSHNNNYNSKTPSPLKTSSHQLIAVAMSTDMEVDDSTEDEVSSIALHPVRSRR